MSFRDKHPGQPEDVLPLEEFQVEESQPEQAVALADLTIEELAEAIAEQRAHNVALNKKQATEENNPESAVKPESRRRGGAFGGALKRRIERTDSAEKLAATNEHDIALVTASNLRAELFPDRRGDLTYGGVLFTPSEYGSITISPPEFARRIGARVMAKEDGRSPSEKLARRQEVVTESLTRQQLKTQLEQARLEEEMLQVGRLRREMRTPGYSHMSMDEIDGLMAVAEKVYVDMFEAVIANHRLPTERVESLTAAMQYLVSADYKKTFQFWQQMTGLAYAWNEAKRQRFQQIEANIAEELPRIHG